MATQSLMRTLGTTAPDFALPDVRTGDVVKRSDFEGRPLVVLFICNHCPYVKRIQPGLAALGADYAGTDLGIVGISSNDADNYPAEHGASRRRPRWMKIAASDSSSWDVTQH